MDREQAIKEIVRLADEHDVPVLIFPEKETMKQLMEDMRLGANVRAGMKQMNISLEKEFLM